MSSKPDDHHAAKFALPCSSVLSLLGPDAIAFAQAQFANDVTQLETGRWQWNTWLSPKGRVIALFRLARPEPETLLAVLSDFPANALAERLARFVFRSHVKLGAAALPVAGRWEADPLPHEARVEGDLSTGLRLRLDAQRVLLLDPAEIPLTETHTEPQAWRLADIRAGIPRLDPADVEVFTAHMLGLDALGAFSLRKGCFPGHEILARSHYLGQVKRGLHRVRCESALPQRDDVHSGDRVIGRLLCSAELPGGGSEGLAVLPLDEDESAQILMVNGRVLLRA